jgi:hypothetical protein
VVDGVIGRGTVLSGRYELIDPRPCDLPDTAEWQATDQILGRRVVVRVFPAAGSGPALDAARRAALVADPRLVRVLDVGSDEGFGYVITELVAGPTLALLVGREPLSADQARAIVGEAASALEVARRRGVHHLALRPSALAVSDDGRVLISGTAVDAVLLGRPGGDARTTSRTDAADLVRLVYAALTGHWPGPGETADGLPTAPAVDGVPVPPADLVAGVPGDLNTLCAVTLGRADDGPLSPADLVRELEPWGEIRVLSKPKPLFPPVVVADPVGPVTEPGQVVRQSVRSAFVGPTAAARPGTPPPASPSRDAITPPMGVPFAFAAGPASPAGDELAAAADESPFDWSRPDPVPTTPFGPAGAAAEVPPVAGAAPLIAPLPGWPAEASSPGLPGPEAHVSPSGLPSPESDVSSAGFPGPGAVLTSPGFSGPAAGVSSSGFPGPEAGVRSPGSGADERPTPASAEQGRPAAATPPTAPLRAPTGAIPATWPPAVARTSAFPPPPAAAVPIPPAASVFPAAAARTPTQPAAPVAPPAAPVAARAAAPTPPSVPPAQTPPSDSGPFDFGSLDEGPPRRTGMGIAIAIVAVLVVVAIGFAAKALFSGHSATLNPGTAGHTSQQSPTGGSTSQQPSATAASSAPTAPPVISGITSIDPTGGSGDHQELVGRAFDGNPTTYWMSLTYKRNDFAGFKPALGLQLQLTATATIRTVTLHVNGTGGNVEIRTGDATTPTGGTVLASGPMSQDAVFTLNPTQTTSSLVIWFTQLPTTADGSFRIELTEIQLG